MPKFNYGGQALIEGVLMRGRDAIAVAFRHPDGHIVWASESLDKGPHAWRFAKTPFVRGLNNGRHCLHAAIDRPALVLRGDEARLIRRDLLVSLI